MRTRMALCAAQLVVVGVRPAPALELLVHPAIYKLWKLRTELKELKS